ncbi:MAG: Crp/Fnr family transcriptional regulator [Candidatus Promineifilaceae bacterium]
MQKSAIISLLASLPTFQAASATQLGKMAETMQIESVQKRKPFALRVPPLTHYVLPLSANVNLFRESGMSFGMRLPLGVLWPIRLEVGQVMWLRCADKGWVGLLSSDVMAKLMLDSAEIRTAILQSMLASSRHATNQLEQYACSDLTGRVAQLLLDLHEDNNGNMIKYAHSHLAQLLNAQRESVSLIIGRFRRAGWVATSYGRIRIEDERALLRIAFQY